MSGRLGGCTISVAADEGRRVPRADHMRRALLALAVADRLSWAGLVNGASNPLAQEPSPAVAVEFTALTRLSLHRGLPAARYVRQHHICSS